MLRALLNLGRARLALGGEELENYVRPASGKLYVLDLYPKEKRAALIPYELDEKRAKRFLYVGDPPAANAPRDRPTTKPQYLLGQVATRMAEDPELRKLLGGVLWEPGCAGGKVRYLLDLRDFHLEGAKDVLVKPFQVIDGVLRVVEKPCPHGAHDEKKEGKGAHGEKEEGKGVHAGILAGRLAKVLQKAFGVEPARKGETLLFTLALEGTPLADMEAYRAYLRRVLWEGPFAKAGSGLCHGCGRKDRVLADFSAFSLKFYITDKKSFAPGVWKEAFPRAYALCQDCYRALQVAEVYAASHLTLGFMDSEALVLPEAEMSPEVLSRLVDHLLAQVRGLERLSAWREFLAQAGLSHGAVEYLGFTLVLYRRVQAATKVREVVLDVPPSRVEGLFGAMDDARERGFAIGGLYDLLYLFPVDQEREDQKLPLATAASIFAGLPLDPGEVLPLWLRTAERVFRQDGSLYGVSSRRYVGARGALDLVHLGAGWLWILKRLGLWGGSMGEEAGKVYTEEALLQEYGFGPLQTGLYLLGRALEEVGSAQAKLYSYEKEPLLESIGWQGMSLVRVRHMVGEVMAKANYYLDGGARTRVLELLARATDLLERGQGRLTDREIPYYILMGYAQARKDRLHSSKKKEVADAPEL